MAPEQIRGDPVDRRVDVYAASVVLWETLAGRALFRGDNDGMLFSKVIEGAKEPPSAHQPGLPRAIDDVVMRGLRLDPAERFASAREMAIALEDAAGVAPPRHVGEWIEALAGASIAERAERIKEIESMSSSASIVGDSDEVRLVAAKPRPAGNVAGRPADKPELQSQVSSVSLAGNTPASSGSPIRGRYVVAALVLLLAGATLFWLGRAGAPTAASDVSASSPNAPPPSAPPAAVVVAAEPVASTPSSVTPPSTSATTGPDRTAAPARKTPAAPRKPPKNCNPPFIIDSGGIKRPKPECL